MAFSVTFAPEPGLRLMRSPLMVVMQETTDAIRNDVTFRYFCRVEADGVTLATLLRSPDPNDYGVFDISPLFEDLITQTDSDQVSANDNDRVQDVVLECGYFLDGVESLEETIATFQVSDGFAVQQVAINSYENSAEVINAERFLTPVETIQIVNGQPAWIHVYTSSEDERRIQYRTPNGLNPWTSAVVPALTEIWRIPIDVASVNGSSSNPSFTADNGYLIQIIDSVTTDVYQQIKVEVLDASFCDIPNNTIAYINRFGVWDYIHLRGQSFESLNQNRTKWTRRIGRTNVLGGYTYPTTQSQVGVTEVMGQASITFNTGYVKASAMNEKLKDLLLSKTFFNITTQQPLILKTSNIAFKNDSDANLINYTLEFEIAGNLIQSIN